VASIIRQALIWGGEVAEDIELDPTKLKNALRKEVGILNPKT